MTRPHFTLAVVCSADARIASAADAPPQHWASAEEQALFFRDIADHDWAIMGRHTHVAADRPDRHRIVFSSRGGGWKRPTQLWLDPAGLSPADLAAHVALVRPLGRGLILGGTRVHDWFLAARAVDRVHLTIEPVVFGAGLDIVLAQRTRDPLAVFMGLGFVALSERLLNAGGTRYLVLRPG